jgi:DUF971 family protein
MCVSVTVLIDNIESVHNMISNTTKQNHPLDLTIDREAAQLTVEWADGHTSRYRLPWLRKVCPCATCLEERDQAANDPLRLMSGPLPSAVVESAELVGNYAIRFSWADGHGNGIYGFTSLRASCPCAVCNAGEPEYLLTGGR